MSGPTNRLLRRVHSIRERILVAIIEILPAELWIRIVWRIKFGEPLNLVSPTTYNEKVQFLKIRGGLDGNTLVGAVPQCGGSLGDCPRNARNGFSPVPARDIADKYAVRAIVADRIGERYLSELIGVYDDPRSIPWDELPGKYVIKATHGSGMNIIVDGTPGHEPPRTVSTRSMMTRTLQRWLARDYSRFSKELVYRGIRPRLIVESYIEGDGSGDGSPIDYKFFCFRGEPRFIQVDMDRYTRHRRNYYDTDWNFLSLETDYPSDPSHAVPRPERLDEMLSIARALSAGFRHIRVDLYFSKDRIIFGELTFYHGSGFKRFNTREWELRLGELLDLPPET